MNHMNSKTLLGLAAGALLAIGIAVAISTGRKPRSHADVAIQPAVPELRDHVNDVRAIQLTGAGNQSIATIEKGANGWTVKQKGGYPADNAKVREFLLKLSDARLVERKTDREQRYGELGVSDVTAADAKGVLVALDGLATPAQLIIGNVGARGDTTYVRRAGEKESWAANSSLAADKSVANWLDKTLADIPATRVREVVLMRPDGKSLRAYKEQPADTNFKVADVPKGRVLSSEFAANSLGTTLAGLNLEDVYAATESAPPKDGKVHKARYAGFDGLVVDVVAWKDGERALAQFDARIDAAAADAAIVAEQARAKAQWAQRAAEAPVVAPASVDGKPASSDPNAAEPAAKPIEPEPLAVSDPAKDRTQRLAALESELASLKQRFDSRTFVLPSHKFANIDKGIDDVLAPLEDKKAKKVDAAKPAAM